MYCCGHHCCHDHCPCCGQRLRPYWHRPYYPWYHQPPVIIPAPPLVPIMPVQPYCYPPINAVSTGLRVLAGG